MVRLRKKTTTEIIDELRQGLNREANYKLLFDRHYDQVYRFFRRKRLSPEDSRDLTQEVFVSVHRGLKSLRIESQFDNWLFKIARNIFANEMEHRGAKKRQGLVVPLEEKDTGLGERRGVVRKTTDPKSPIEQLLEKERDHKLNEAIQGLPMQMRRSVQLRVMKGLSYAEIAAVMGVSINTVKAHLHQARKVLRKDLGQYFNDIEL
jgi:RNA polymerase sigma-70 factor (ECF subfamily)